MKYHVICTESCEIIRTFDTRAEAQYFITDCFGPEWHTVRIVEND